MMKTQHVGFTGGGRVTRILLQAFKNKALNFDSVKVFDPDTGTLNALKNEFPNIEPVSSPEEAAKQEILFLAVHPPLVMETIGGIKEAVSPETIVISLSPKITIEKMAADLPTARIMRMIPNATSFINKGYNPVTFHTSFTREEKKNLLKFLKKAGKTMEVEESMLEGYAIVSAMLPTYFWFQWKKMEEIAVQTGFTEAEGKKVIRKTLNRSVKLYFNAGLTPEEVMDLIPVKPIGDHEAEIEQIMETKLMGLYDKIRP
jgi:pyrroline-5-carboxylate reductase